GERVEDAGQRGAALTVEHLRRRFVVLNDDRLFQATREIEMTLEHRDLRLARRMVVMKVEATLADRDDAIILREPFDLSKRGVVAILRFMRMKTDGSPYVVVLLGKRQRLARVLEFGRRDDEPAHVLRAGTIEIRRAVGHR